MKKISVIIGIMCMALALSACGNNAAKEDTKPTETVQETEDTKEVETKQTEKEEAEAGSLEELNESIMKYAEDSVNELNEEYEQLKTDIDTYKKFIDNTDTMEGFYSNVVKKTQDICIRLREYSIEYAELIMASDKENDEKYDDLDELYDNIYEDACDVVYDEIYDGLLEDMYDDFYDGLLDDAYDNDEYGDYKEWADVRSDEYERWSDSRSDVYEEWSDSRSDIYGFWSDMRGEFYDDFEKTDKIIQDFQKDVEKLKGKDSDSSKEEDTSSKKESASKDEKKKDIPKETKPQTEQAETEAANDNLVDGMRPEFKEAMDTYEEFMNEYCDFMNKYAASDGTDLGLLSDYADYMDKYADVVESFEAWDDGEMNNAEMAYYLDVQTRINKKLLEIAQ